MHRGPLLSSSTGLERGGDSGGGLCDLAATPVSSPVGAPSESGAPSKWEPLHVKEQSSSQITKYLMPVPPPFLENLEVLKETGGGKKIVCPSQNAQGRCPSGSTLVMLQHMHLILESFCES